MQRDVMLSSMREIFQIQGIERDHIFAVGGFALKLASERVCKLGWGQSWFGQRSSF
jgi:hypothetical protein